MEITKLLEFLLPAVLIAGIVVWVANSTRNTFVHHKFVEWDDKPISSEDF